MWAIKNETSYAAERTWVRDKNGAHRWSVVVKATFDLGTDGAVRRVEEHPGRLVTVLIEPQRMRVILCWQASLPVRPTDVDSLDETLIRERPFPS